MKDLPVIGKRLAAGPLNSPIRVAPLSNVEPLLRSLGHDPEPVFAAVGLDSTSFLDSEHRIPYAKGAQLLEHCARTTGEERFGLLLGQFFLLTHLGFPGLLASKAATTRVALHDLVHHFAQHDRGGVVTLYTSSRYTTLGYAINVPEAAAADQIYDLCIFICCALMRMFCGPDWQPGRVELSRNPPADSQPYKAFFRAPVLFNSVRNAVVFSNKWLDYPLATADAGHHEELAVRARALHKALPDSISLEVRTALYSRLANAACNAATIANLLGLQERTLHRRLQCEGTSFRALLNETRRISSCNYLKGTSLPIHRIASALGYRSTGAFDHAFKRWFGASPKQWRDRMQEPGSAFTPPPTAPTRC